MSLPVYSFDRKSLIKSFQRPEGAKAKEFTRAVACCKAKADQDFDRALADCREIPWYRRLTCQNSVGRAWNLLTGDK